MKKINSLFIIVFFLTLSLSGFSQRLFKQSMNMPAGDYLFNTDDLYFFDDGIDCYLLGDCNDVDTVFENGSTVLHVEQDSSIKYQAYLFTDTYEYVYTKIDRKEGWLRIDVDLPDNRKDFVKAMLSTLNYDSKSCYVEVIPFKRNHRVFVSTTDFWYIADLKHLKNVQIGSKGGRLEACKMVYRKNCVQCYIDLGWGEEVWYDSKGKKISKRFH